MKIRALTLMLTALGALALVACKETTPGGGGGGAGGTGGNGGGGSGGGACADSCALAITDGSTPCAGMGDTQYSDLVSCASGSCPTECSSLIAGGASDATCGDCLTASCKTESDACANN
jgi:hypothetical protein